MRILEFRWSIALCAMVLVVAGTSVSLGDEKEKAKSPKAQIERGLYLVNVAGCHDCHSAKTMSPKGPIPHPMKLLSGHQADVKVDAPPQGLSQEKWIAATNADQTAWAGPWGISFAANITPDPATGIGAWTEEMFINTIRKGKHLGTGRDILPPMPWFAYAQMTDQDLKSVFAYLKSLKAVHNPVPQPIPPGSKPQ